MATGRLAGKVALVTGGASGIGSAVARRFAAEGARVGIADIDEAGAAALAASLDGGLSVRCDVTDEASVEAAVAHVVAEAGGLDAVVANAGGGGFAPIMDQPLEEWRRVTDLCETSVFLTLKHAGKALADQGRGGSITCIASLNGVQPAEGMSAYCAAKAAVVMLAQVAAMELGRHGGIRVNSVLPGLIETPATGAFFSMPAVVEDFVKNGTVGRHGTPDDVAALCTFLASDEASFVSGSAYSVDGGARTGRYPDLFHHFLGLPPR